MDNTNTNWPNNPSPAPANGTTPPSPMPDYGSPVPPAPQDPAAPAPWPTTPPPLPSSPIPASQPSPASFDTSANPSWTPTPEPLPLNTNPLYSNPAPAANPPTWPTATSATVEPTPPLTNPQPSNLSSDPGGNLAMNSSPSVSTSPLDNPWGAPVQAPPIDGPDQTSQPTWTPPPTTNDATVNPLPSTMDNTMPINDSIPTDLSHLISNNAPTIPNSTGTENAPVSSAETLVVPPTTPSTSETPTVPAQAHQGMPKWLIGVGIGLLIMVAGASAYFILGVGQSPKTTSIPAEVTSKQTVKTPPPIATPPQASPAAVATDSANFGELQGSGTTSPQASSAAELLKQRQQAQ